MSDDSLSGYRCGLTAGAVELLIHTFYTPFKSGIERDGDSASDRSFAELVNEGLVCPRETGDHEHSRFKVTERGEAFVLAILDLPLPVQKWAMP